MEIWMNIKQLCHQSRHSWMHTGVDIPPLPLMLTEICCVSLCLWLLLSAAEERQGYISHSMTLPGVFGMAETGGRHNCLEATMLVPYQNLHKPDGYSRGNASVMLSQQLCLVCMREVAKRRFNNAVKVASKPHLLSHISEITFQAFGNVLSCTEDGFCSQIVTLLWSTLAFCEISSIIFLCKITII